LPFIRKLSWTIASTVKGFYFMKKEIAEKLGLGERSVNLILQNKELCDRILKETPIKIFHVCEKYGISLSNLNTLIDKGIISSFSNKHKKGSPVFVFEEEIIQYFQINYNNSKHYKLYEKIGRLFLIACRDILTEREYDSLADVFYKDKNNLSQQISQERINQIRKKAFNKLYRYSDKMKLNTEIMIIEDNLQRLLEKKRSIERTVKKEKDSKEIEQKKLIHLYDLDLSVRAFNVLSNANIKYLGELIQYSIDDITKFRNMGSRTLDEIKNKLKEYGFELSKY